RLACRAIVPPAPVLIAIGGLSGTGKSVLARHLAPDLAPDPGAVILRSDVARKALFGKDETEKLPAEAYQETRTSRAYAAPADRASRVLATGHSAIADAVCARPEEREALAAAARQCGVGFRGFFLVADLATRLARVGARERDASDAHAEVARQQESYDLGSLDWTKIDARDTPEATQARVTSELT